MSLPARAAKTRYNGGMKRWAQLADVVKRLLIVAVLFASPLRADQTAPELDGLFALLKGDLEAAAVVAVTQEIWSAWLRHDDDEVRALMRAGMRDMRAARWRDALGRFNAAVDLAPDFAEAWNKRATVYYLMGDFAASTTDVVKTLRLEPRHFGALVGQGMMFMQAQNVEQALSYFRRALAVNPHMDNVRGYVDVLLRLQNLSSDPKAI